MNFTTPHYLRTKIDIISKDEELLDLFTKLLKIMNNNYKNSFFSKNNTLNKQILTMSITNNYKIDIDFYIKKDNITLLNILIHDEWFSNI